MLPCDCGAIWHGFLPAGMWTPLFCICCRDYISCGAMTLDIALGGGFPKGRIVEVGVNQEIQEHLAVSVDCLPVA
jgi:recA bacterial DNA recombination protein